MARKKFTATETLSAPRRRSPRLLSNNSPEEFNPKPAKSEPNRNPNLHNLSTPITSTPKPEVLSNKCTKFGGPEGSNKSNGKIVVTISPSKLRRSGRIREIKEKQEDTKNGTGDKIDRDFSRVLSSRVGKMASTTGTISFERRGMRAGRKSSCGESYNNLSIDLTRRVAVKVKMYAELSHEILYKGATRSASLRNGSECGERNGNVDSNLGDNGSENPDRGGCKDVKFIGVEESTLIAKRVTRSATFRNGSKCKRYANVDCKSGGDYPLSEVLEGQGFKNEKSKRVVEESTLIAKRVTRSASLRNRSQCEERNVNVDCNAGPLSEVLDGGGFKDEKSEKVVEEPPLIYERVTRSASLRNGSGYDERNGNADCNAGDNHSLSENLGGGDFKNEKSKRVEESNLGNAKEKNVGKKQLGQKRKKNQQKGECGCSNSWTKEQEVALQRAYFAEKPTPHFWKKVAKMVPGKSAQDCFDRIHSDHKTPQTRKLSRAKRATPPSLSFTASKLVNSTTKGTRKSKFGKRNRHLAQKTLRHLLQKQVHVNKDGADLFAILEKTVDPSNRFSQQSTPHSTPKQTKRGLNFPNVFQETFSPAHRKKLSRLSNLSGVSLTSPPVLKQIKNKALHEKYIDQLHCREAKRRASVARSAKQVKSNIEDNRVHGGNTEAVKAARNALVLDATEAINQFQQSQNSAVDSWDLCDDEVPCSDDDDE